MNDPTRSAVLRARSFAEILDDVALAGDERDTAAPGQRFSGASAQDWLFSLLDGNSTAAEPAHRDFEAAFFPEAEEASDSPAPRFGTGFDIDVETGFETHFDMDEDRIAAELGLAAACSGADLARARRAFALRNHPDRFPASVRAKANARMQLANMLLDRRRKEIEAGR